MKCSTDDQINELKVGGAKTELLLQKYLMGFCKHYLTNLYIVVSFTFHCFICINIIMILPEAPHAALEMLYC